MREAHSLSDAKRLLRLCSLMRFIACGTKLISLTYGIVVCLPQEFSLVHCRRGAAQRALVLAHLVGMCLVVPTYGVLKTKLIRIPIVAEEEDWLEHDDAKDASPIPIVEEEEDLENG